MILELALGVGMLALLAVAALHIGTLHRLLVRRDVRVAELERQIDELHAQGLSITPASEINDQTDAKVELPQELAQFVSGFEDSDDQDEYREYIQSRLARGADAIELAREFEA